MSLLLRGLRGLPCTAWTPAHTKAVIPGVASLVRFPISSEKAGNRRQGPSGHYGHHACGCVQLHNGTCPVGPTAQPILTGARVMLLRGQCSDAACGWVQSHQERRSCGLQARARPHWGQKDNTAWPRLQDIYFLNFFLFRAFHSPSCVARL